MQEPEAGTAGSSAQSKVQHTGLTTTAAAAAQHPAPCTGALPLPCRGGHSLPAPRRWLLLGDAVDVAAPQHNLPGLHRHDPPVGEGRLQRRPRPAWWRGGAWVGDGWGCQGAARGLGQLRFASRRRQCTAIERRLGGLCFQGVLTGPQVQVHQINAAPSHSSCRHPPLVGLGRAKGRHDQAAVAKVEVDVRGRQPVASAARLHPRRLLAGSVASKQRGGGLGDSGGDESRAGQPLGQPPLYAAASPTWPSALSPKPPPPPTHKVAPAPPPPPPE